MAEAVFWQVAPVVELVLRGLVAGNEGPRKVIGAELLGTLVGFRA